MINQFLQFLKKQQLAIKLARYDALFLLRGLPGFAVAAAAASLFRRPRRGLATEKLQRLMAEERDPLLNIFVTETGYRYDPVVPPSKQDALLLAENAVSAREEDFYQSLFRGFSRKSGTLRPVAVSFRRRADLLFDRRLYASELEELITKESGFEKMLPFEVDWALTDRDNVCLTYPPETVSAIEIPGAYQQNFALLFASLFFERSTLVSGWRAVVYDSTGRLNFSNIDSLQPVDYHLKNFAVKFLRGETAPGSYAEHKLVSAIKLLQYYCPEIRLAEIWDEYIQTAPFSQPMSLPESSKKQREALLQTDFAPGFRKPLQERDPRELAHLLRPRSYRRDKQFANSSIRIWLPLLLGIYLLYRYF